MSELRGPVFAKQDYAGFPRRMLALLVDFLLMHAVLAAALTSYVISTYLSSGIPEEPDARVMFWLCGAWLVFAVTYNFVFRLFENGTLGYRLIGIRYAYMLNGRPDKFWVVTRSLWAVFLTGFFALNHLWILFDPNKQAWHDKLGGFYVVKKSARPIGEQRVNRGYIGFLGYNFIVWEPAAHGSAKP